MLFASTNKGKINEAKGVCGRMGVELVSPYELESSGPIPNVVEDADSYAGNCKLKADAFFVWSGLPSLADDTGLEVAALNGRPGVLSARFAGENADGPSNSRKLLHELDMLQRDGNGAVDRTARFVCTLILAFGNGKYIEANGILEGSIARQPKGEGGFGYDSVFLVKGYDNKTLAELKEENAGVKTHRILALEQIARQLAENVADF